MRDCCHGISSADLLYNRFSDDTSCCPATCSVSRELCFRARFHGSFPSSSKTSTSLLTSQALRTSSDGERASVAQAARTTRWDVNVFRDVCPSSLSIILCDSDERLLGSSVKNEAISCSGRGSSAGQLRLVGKWRPSLLSRMFYTGLNRTIHLNQRPVQAHSTCTRQLFLFTKMTTSSFHE